VRTAIGDLLGGLKDLNSVELGVIALKAAMEKAGVDPLWRWGPSTSMIIEAMYE
jgi:acetyl-CoA acetyltransferase